MIPKGGTSMFLLRRFSSELAGVTRLLLLLCFVVPLVSCGSSFQGGPTPLYSQAEAQNYTREMLGWLKARYYEQTDETLRAGYRNEYIGVYLTYMSREYYAYEARLTGERQRVGFGLGVASLGLNAAGSLDAFGRSTLFSGLAGTATGIRGQYDSEVLFAKTLQIIQAQMRSNRDSAAAHILRGMQLSTRDYPLSIAEADLEDFYGAGTLTAGLLKTAESVGRDAAASETEKKLVIEGKYAPDDSSETIRRYVFVDGIWNEERYQRLQTVLTTLDASVELFQILDRAEYAELRDKLIKDARSRGIAL